MATIESTRVSRTELRAAAFSSVGPSAGESPAASPVARQQLAGRIGPWQLVRLLHESELTRIYAARPAEAADHAPAGYAVKVLRKEWWREPHAIEMQRRAAAIGRRVSHPHLLPVLSSGVDQPPFYIVSPKLPGRSLAEILAAGQRLSLSATLWIARQTAEALAALHDARMIHADVKPANIIVADDGHATLIDLGFVHAPQEGRHWSSRPVYGTLNYLAPECMASCLGASPQSDLYSLGVMLYEMLALRLPFVGCDAEQLMRHHRETQPTPLSQIRGGIPEAIATLVQRLLAKDPLRRPTSAAALVEQLVRLEIECFETR